MFGDRFYNFARESAPELWNLDVRIGGQAAPLSNYDKINALMVRNNFLAVGKDRIAVFNPPGTLSDVYALVVAGISSYGNASGMGFHSVGGFKPEPGELVYYEGKIVRFVGWEKYSDEDEKKFVLANEDKWKTETILPASRIGMVYKYSGTRTTPDPSDSKSKTAPVQKTIGAILGTSPEKVRLADYSAILICLANATLIDLLKETTINGTRFFDLFPSVRWTPSGEQRLGRDNKKKSYMFYFTGSLSSADDILRSPEGTRVRGLVVDAGRALHSTSLLSSMVSDYPLEKAWVFGGTNDLTAMQKLKKAGFKIWVWTIQDFKDMHDIHELVQGSAGIPATAVSRHFEVLDKAVKASFAVEEVGYPIPFTKEEHAQMQASISFLKKWNNGVQNPAVDEFLVSAFGLLSKLFQTPFPPALLGSGTPWAVDVCLGNLKMKAVIILEQLPQQERRIVSRFMESLAKAVQLFLNHRSKYEVIRAYVNTNNYIVVKRPQFITLLDEFLSNETRVPRALIITQPQYAVSLNSTLVWTYKPNLQQFVSGLFATAKTVFIGYPLQLEEWNSMFSIYKKMSEEFGSVPTRSEILKIDGGLFELAPQRQSAGCGLEEFADLESKLLASRLFFKISGQEGISSGDIPARQVVFTGGFSAFFEESKMVRIIDSDNEGIVQKFPDKLIPGDKVVFLKDERETIFDELVGYYGHRPDVVNLLRLSESWRDALKKYYEVNKLSIQDLRVLLENAGLGRTEASIENWLSGRVICPPENNYHPIDVIAAVTNDGFLLKEKWKVKDAARKVHSMRIKIGRYLARRIVQSAAVSRRETEDDLVLAGKLDKISSCAEVAEIEAISPDTVRVAPSLVNRLLGTEDF